MVVYERYERIDRSRHRFGCDRGLGIGFSDEHDDVHDHGYGYESVRKRHGHSDRDGQCIAYGHAVGRSGYDLRRTVVNAHLVVYERYERIDRSGRRFGCDVGIGRGFSDEYDDVHGDGNRCRRNGHGPGDRDG